MVIGNKRRCGRSFVTVGLGRLVDSGWIDVT